MPRKRNSVGQIDPERVMNAAGKQLPALVKKMLPDGQLRGHRWVGKNSNQNVQRPGSFKIDLLPEVGVRINRSHMAVM